jgi:nucleoid DNA-binding protein
MAKKVAPKAAESKAASATAEKKASKPRSKSEIFSKLSEASGLTKKQVQGVFDALTDLIKNDLGKKGPGVFVVPGLLKLTVQRKPATKAGERWDQFRKETRMFPAKPARNIVKPRALKALKEMV